MKFQSSDMNPNGIVRREKSIIWKVLRGWERPLLKWGKSFRGLQYMIGKGFESYTEKGREILKLGEESYEKKMKKGYERLSKELSDIMKRV